MQKKLFRRNSQQRDMILEELRKVKTHPTSADLYNAVRKRIPNISLGTVYRNLDLLSRKGIIRKLEIGGKESRFDGDIESHYHIRCSECGKIDDIHDLKIEDIDLDNSNLKGYNVQGYHIEFSVICPDCRNLLETL